MEEIVDVCFWLYVLISLLSLFGFILFSTEWADKGEASNVFKYVTFMFLGSFIEHTMNGLVRFFYLIGSDKGHYIRHSFLWSARLVIPFVVIFLIVFTMSKRKLKGH